MVTFRFPGHLVVYSDTKLESFCLPRTPPPTYVMHRDLRVSTSLHY